MVCSRAVRSLFLASCLLGCTDATEAVRGEWVVDTERLAAHERLAPLPKGPARTLVTDFARDHYADTAFRFDPPVCSETRRGAAPVERPCEVVRVDRRRVVVLDLRHADRLERVRLYVAKDGTVDLERGRHRLPLMRAAPPR